MLLSKLNNIFWDAFDRLDVDPSLGRVTRSDRPDLCHYQCNGAMPAAGQLSKSPRDIATKIIDIINDDPRADVIDDLSIAGPGFINITVKQTGLTTALKKQFKHERLGILVVDNPDHIILDFGGPNIAKELHVGHLRSHVIGESLQRILRSAGQQVTSDVHLGDWGLPYGMLIAEIEREQPELPYFDPERESFPDESPVSLSDLAQLYPQASARAKEDEAFRTKARKYTAAMQEGHPGFIALWRHFKSVTVADLKRLYDRLDINFDLWLGESDTQPIIGDMINDLRKKGLAIMDQGALVIPMPDDMPPLILEKGDGGVTYGATDLATIKMRAANQNADEINYIVDHRQHLHFQQVFIAADLAGYMNKDDLIHLGFGTMNSPDGSPFKTREGGLLPLHEFLDMARQKACDRMAENNMMGELGDTAENVAEMVGMAAIKFADLSNPIQSNYIFDPDKFIRFEGATGPYLQYTSVRLNALLNNVLVEDQSAIAHSDRLLVDDDQMDLALSLLHYGPAVESAARNKAPNILCDYLFELAQQVNRFYQAHHVMSHPDKTKKLAYVSILDLSRQVINHGLELLGISVPERM
jgi:arginyl-tRNA synthetase